MAGNKSLRLQQGQVVRVTKLFADDKDVEQVIPAGEAWWAVGVDDGFEWVTTNPGLDIWVDHDEFEIFEADEAPDEYYVEVAKRALLGEVIEEDE